jgi:hypothetical protein
MEPDDYTSTSTIMLGDVDVSTYSLSDYTEDTIDISALTDTITITGSSIGSLSSSTIGNIDWNSVHIVKDNREDVRDEGSIPVDIWARMYNNGRIDD